MASKTYKLDIFETIRKINNSDLEYWNTLEEEQKKAFAPLVVMRWLSFNDPFEIYMINHLVNKHIFVLGKHKQLLYNLMCISTGPRSGRHTFIKRLAKDSKFPKSLKVLAEYLECSIREAKDNFQFYSNDDIIEIIQIQGHQKEFLAEIKRELKVRNV